MLNNEDERWNSYFYEGTNTLINKFGILDSEEEKQKEEEESFERLVELYINPIKGNFDKEHLKKIHKHIFGTMYDWAGEYRYVNTTKYNEVYNIHSYFTDYERIDEALTYELDRMEKDIKQINSLEIMIYFLAEYYVVLLDIHPFREGNGRTMREFLREYVEEKTKDMSCGAMELDWSKMDENRINECIELAKAFRGNIELEFRKGLSYKEKQKTANI